MLINGIDFPPDILKAINDEENILFCTLHMRDYIIQRASQRVSLKS